MFKLLLKGLSTLAILLSLNTIQAQECCETMECSKFYIGGFGGGLYSNKPRITQMGTAFFTEAEGGPLAVDARGRSRSTSTGFGGVQVGYEWLSCPFNFGCSNWTFSPAAELEAFWYTNHIKGHLINPTVRLPEHDFLDSFRLNMSTCLVNAVFTLNNSDFFGLSPYVGGGIGAAHSSLKNAKSIQVDPPEVGINHFNSRRHDTTWAFAAQVKAGLRYKFCECFEIFGEYRYLFVDSSNYILGSTVYPNHAATSPWNVKVKDIHYNAFAFGLRYAL